MSSTGTPSHTSAFTSIPNTVAQPAAVPSFTGTAAVLVRLEYPDAAVQMDHSRVAARRPEMPLIVLGIERSGEEARMRLTTHYRGTSVLAVPSTSTRSGRDLDGPDDECPPFAGDVAAPQFEVREVRRYAEPHTRATHTPTTLVEQTFEHQKETRPRGCKRTAGPRGGAECAS